MTHVRIIVLKIRACPNYQRRAKIRTAPCFYHIGKIFTTRTSYKMAIDILRETAKRVKTNKKLQMLIAYT